MTRYITLIASCLLILSCAESQNKKPLRVGFNTWPGYEFIYLAKVKGLYQQRGLEVRLVELSSLGDVRRAFERGQIDIMASTVVEILIAAENTRRPIKIIAVPDASNGSDMLLAAKKYRSIAALKGRRLGLEGSTVDILTAAAALRSGNLGFDQLTLITKSQDDLETDILSGNIDAIQTYPPYSVRLLNSGKVHKLYDTSKIPGEIIDVLSIDAEVLQSRRTEIKKFLDAFFEAQNIYLVDPVRSSEIMSKRERISAEEFRTALQGVIILRRDQQLQYLLPEGKGEAALKRSHNTLYKVGWLKHKTKARDFLYRDIAELYKKQ